MKYVVDASVALREDLPGPLTGKAQALKTDFLNKIHELLAPDIFPAEIASALTKAERQKLIAVGHGAAYYAKLGLARSSAILPIDRSGDGHLLADPQLVP